MSPIVEAPIRSVMVSCSGLRCRSQNSEWSGPAGASHQVGLPHTFELAFVRQQVHNRAGRFRREQTVNGFPQANLALRQRSIRKNRRVEMPARVCSRANRAEERAAVGKRCALGEAHDEGQAPFVAPLRREREPVAYGRKIQRWLPLRESWGLAERRANQVGALGQDDETGSGSPQLLQARLDELGQREHTALTICGLEAE